MESHQKKPNKIREIVRLQQILKKWRKLAINSSSSSSSAKPSSAGNKSMQFLKRTISFSDRSTSTSCTELLASSSNSNTTSTNSSTNNQHQAVPKGYLAVCVGEEMKRFVIPTEYLGRHAFHVLLREAEEEFGFEQTGGFSHHSDHSPMCR
ncbi:hypothetical protein TIFTF001_009114 [Ficus carica]|uniref:Uncharacterized protein n=1 Tax=Ficus carica TaxID=3494 RepID=A0AA88D3C5_FICCA|nr:hypothetical protein TIFTF001_009114 [Ficus carica]